MAGARMRIARGDVPEVTFEGITYRRYEGRRYYVGYDRERKVKVALHRSVYEAHHGPIPEGWHVHHVDHDTENNEPENLEAQPPADHLSHHGKDDRSIERRCDECGETYRTGRAWGVRWCSVACKERNYRRTARYGEDRVCIVCSRRYEVADRRAPGKTCSRECQERSQEHRIICEHCGEEAIAKRPWARFCSGRCKQRAAKVAS